LPTDKPAAFFSYCRDDSEFAFRLAEDLKAAGANVWMDQLDIRPGQRWERAVEDALSSCTCMLLILSPASISSANVMDEVSFALDELKTVIPVLYSECKVPYRLRTFQRVDFRNDYAQGLKDVLKALRGIEYQEEQLARQTATETARPERERKRPAEQATPRASGVPKQNARSSELKCESVRELRILCGHTVTVNAVVVTPNGELAVSASGDKTLKVWELSSGRELRTLSGHSDWVSAVAVTLVDRLAVSASYDQTLKVWELDSGRELRTLRGHTWYVTAAAVTADGQLAVSASEDGVLKVWDLGSGRELRTLHGHSGSVYAVVVTPDDQLAVSASYGELKVWELGSGREIRTLTGHSGRVNAVAVTLGGQLAVSASSDKTLKVWELGSGRELRTLRGHTGEVNAVAVTPDGHLAVSVSDDLTLRVWEVASGRELLTFTADARLYCCAAAPDRKTILTGDLGGAIHVLSLE